MPRKNNNVWKLGDKALKAPIIKVINAAHIKP